MAVLDISFETKELAWELVQVRPDIQRIRWLMECRADLSGALKEARLKEEDLQKNPMLRTLQLQKHLHH